MKTKILFVALFCMIFLAGTVAAADWDNVVIYENNDLTAKIINTLGLGAEIGEVNLASHTAPTEIREVGYGQNVAVMYYDFSN